VELREQPHPFMATEVTDKGIDRLCEYVAAVRENIGYDMPLSMDHLGHIGVNLAGSGERAGEAHHRTGLHQSSGYSGLGVTLNDDECKKHLKPGTGYFEPSPMWDDVQSNNDRLFS
jgi:hypothetical protein